MMIQVKVNNETKSVASGCSVAQALEQWGYQCEQIAVAINSEFVSRSSYGERLLQADDCVDVVAPVQGG